MPDEAHSNLEKRGPAQGRPEYEVSGRARAVNIALAHECTTSTVQARAPVTRLTGGNSAASGKIEAPGGYAQPSVTRARKGA